MRTRPWAGLATLLALAASVAAAQASPPLFTLRPVIGSVEDRFGNGLAVARDQVLVASYLEDTTGAASFYDLTTGTSRATLVSTQPSENDGFGYRVAASRRLAAVASVTPPAVWVYDGARRLRGAIGLCGWTISLAMHGRRIAAATTCGITVADWPRRQWTLARPAGITGDYLGGAVALDGRRVYLGSPGFAPAPGAPDRVLALDATTGALVWEATAPNGTPGDGFGAQLALVGSRLLVGAPGDDADGVDTGAVYLLDARTGAVLQRYANPTGESGAAFGASVAGDDRVVLVGAPNATIDEPGAGAGLLLDARTGALLDTLAPAPNEADANAGRAVAVTRSRLLVGGSDWSGIGLVGVWAR